MVSLIFQTAITGGWRSRMPEYFCLLCNGLTSILWKLNILIIPVPYDINDTLRQKENGAMYTKSTLPKAFNFMIYFFFKNFLRSLWKVLVQCDFLN